MFLLKTNKLDFKCCAIAYNSVIKLQQAMLVRRLFLLVKIDLNKI